MRYALHASFFREFSDGIHNISDVLNTTATCTAIQIFHSNCTRSRCTTLKYTVKLGYNVMKGSEYTVSLKNESYSNRAV
jgi:hypothetical protein